MGRQGWRLLAAELRHRRRPLTKVAAWSLVEAVPAVLSGALIANALDQGFLAHRPLIGLGWLGLFGLTMVIGAFATHAMFPHLAATVEPLRDAFARRLVSATIRRAVGGIDRADDTGVARLVNLADGVRTLLSALLRSLRPLVFRLAATLVGLLTLVPVVALFVAPALLLALGVFAALVRVLSRQQRTVMLAEEAIARDAATVVSGLRDVVACAAQRRSLTTVDTVIHAQVQATTRLARLTSLRTLVICLGGHLPLLALLMTAPWLISTGHASAGQIVGAITYLSANLTPVLGALVGTVGGWGLQLGAVLRRTHEVTVVPDEPSPCSTTKPGTSPSLDLLDLTFGYGPDATPVVAGLDLTIPYGEHLAVVGPSGIGKSTLAQLLVGALLPQAGEVRLGGVPVGATRGAIALIPQEAYVFDGTLRENLCYLRAEATELELDASVDAVGLRPLAQRLGGYDARLGPDGAQLSSGERQLIALARVHLSTAAVVVLDEATCHLDPAAEARAERAFAARGGTVIVIAHRISSARRANRVLLLDGGVPVVGSHDGLLNSSSLYAELVGYWDCGADQQPERTMSHAHESARASGRSR